jgi:cytochrome P450
MDLQDPPPPSEEELRNLQFWNDEGLVTRGFDRWKELRAGAGRAFYSEYSIRTDAGSWCLMTYADIKAAYLDTERFSSSGIAPKNGRKRLELIPVALDPPEHGKYRRLITPLFSPAAIKAREQSIRQHCRTLIEDIAERGGCAFNRDFAVRFPTAIFIDLMGLPIEKLPQYLELAHTLSQTSPLDPDYFEKVITAEGQVLAEFTHVLEERRRAPRDDVISYLLGCEVDGRPLSQDELLSMCNLLFRGGLDTVAAQLGTCFAHLAQDPELRLRIVRQPQDISAIAEEMIRYYAMAIITRRVTQDIEFAGCPMKAESHLVLPCAAANRDPAQFDDADTFDPDRPRRIHLAFGAGPHSCPGMHLARSELRIALEEWHRRIPDYRLAPGERLRYRTNSAFISLEDFVLTW